MNFYSPGGQGFETDIDPYKNDFPNNRHKVARQRESPEIEPLVNELVCVELVNIVSKCQSKHYYQNTL